MTGRSYPLSGFIDRIDISEFGISHRFRDEIARYHRFRKMVLGIKNSEEETQEIDAKVYAKYVLRKGNVLEKRELLALIKTKFAIKIERYFRWKNEGKFGNITLIAHQKIMPTLTKQALRIRVVSVLRKQGYSIRADRFTLKDNSRENRRDVHLLAKAERMTENEEFITKNIPIIERYLIDGNKIKISKIQPQIIEVKEGTLYETIFKWWNLVWWSLPYERAYGRQMRFVIWDKYHNAPIGLIGLQSPILSWSVRDKKLGIVADRRDYWVNQSLSAQRLGALPPYNYLLGGKLVASLMTTDVVRKKFAKKYEGKKTVLKDRKLPARLLFLTTTGAYGKSSVYNKIKINDEAVSRFIGYTQGSGSFHIPNNLFEDFVKYLEKRDYDVKRGYGSGPSTKMRLINQTMDLLGIPNGSEHGIHRAVYLFPMVKNLEKIIQKNEKPMWNHRTVKSIADYWKKHWAKPRVKTRKEYLDFFAKKFIADTLAELKQYRTRKNQNNHG